MCLFRAPQPAPTPATPTRNDAENQRRQEDERRRNRAATGRQSTIMTGGLGDAAFGTNSTKATLLGAAA